MSRVFFEELVKAVPNVPDYKGAYRSYTIDLVHNLPEDVPPGGFPPYICPSPSLTANAAYAITGEAGEEKEYPGEYWARIYLWQMEEGVLLASDMVNAQDRKSCAESYPYVLAFLFSVIDENKRVTAQRETHSPAQLPAAREKTDAKADQEEHWLYLGLRVGGGNSTWYHDLAFDASSPSTNFLSFNAALQATTDLLSLLAVQVEADVYGHSDTTGRFDDGIGKNYTIWHMTIPLLAKLNLRNDPFKAGLYLGPYLYLPLAWSAVDDDKDFSKMRQPLGLIYGVSTGWKMGHGTLFLDIRMNHLVFFSNDGSKLKNPSNGSTISLGYELGVIKKSR